MIAEVVVIVPGVDGVFDYAIPEHFRNLQSGMLVEIPFGRQAAHGVIWNIKEESDYPEVKPINAVVDDMPVLQPWQRDLAVRMSEYYLALLAACVDLMLPPGLAQSSDTEYSLTRANVGNLRDLTATQRRLVRLLETRGTLRGGQIDAALARVRWRDSARVLIRKGMVRTESVLSGAVVRPKMERSAVLTIEPAEISSFLPKLGRAGGTAAERRLAVLKLLAGKTEPIPLQWLRVETSAVPADITKLTELGLISLTDEEVWRDPLADLTADSPFAPRLTASQTEVDLQVNAHFAGNGQKLPILLHGVTGSGKTEIYLRAVQRVIGEGKQAIVLVPEIALTPQTTQRFYNRFPGQVGVIHSRLSPGERYDTWRKARSGALSVVVGPRSALFTPFPNPGLIILDEAHDGSYYQSEPAPAYSTVTAARMAGEILGAGVLYGSATPSVEMLYQAQNEGWPILRLPQRIRAHRAAEDVQGIEDTLPLPPVEIVDMREELKSGNRSMFSSKLSAALVKVLRQKEQAILYLNRLGSATYVFCRSCGYVLECPRCTRTLTYHASTHELICHTCGYRRQMPEVCPSCGSKQIKEYGTGTERVQIELQKLFPSARIVRWDSQTASNRKQHEDILEKFQNHKADFLVGTQVLAKGLDLPKVTLVGVMLAEVGLYLEDFRASERAFQLLTQVAGRAGRSDLGGKAIFQTFQPENPVIQFAAKHDFEGFYTFTLESRREIQYPPFSNLVRLVYRHVNPVKAESAAIEMAGQLEQWLKEGDFRQTDLIGPVPCFYAKLNNYYRWQIILRGPKPKEVLRGRKLGDWRVEVDPQDLL
ncbi:MAG TPA: primosomal protein N' [Bellilinea sp.]|nr:primosomal protein N' [Bellilinea sp.]